MTAESVRLNPDISSTLIGNKHNKRRDAPFLIEVPIIYVGTQVNLNSFAEMKNKNSDKYNRYSVAKMSPIDVNSEITQLESTDSLSIPDIPHRLTENSFKEKDIPDPDLRLPAGDSLEHIFRTYEIEEHEKPPLIEEYEMNGKFTIPIDKVVNSIPLDYFDSNKKIYYQTIPELLQLLNLEHIPDPHKSKLIEFIRTHSSLFSKSPTDVGKVKDYKASIELDRGKADISMKQYNIPFKIRESAQAILDDYERVGIIERFRGEKPIISNLICLKKPNAANEYRLAIDCRLVNCLYPCKRQLTTSVNEILRQMPPSARHYSVLDISSSYHSIELEEKSRKNFCFWSPNNFLYSMSRLPTGFVESSTFLHHALSNILTECGSRKCRAICYVDDIVLASDGSLQSYIDELIELLSRLFQSGLKINPSKCQILRDSVSFLGYGLRSGKFNISEEKIRSFTELPTPKTRLGLRYYLNSCAYFRTSIPQFASHTAILYDLINSSDPNRQKHKPFRFLPEHQLAFDKLRNHIRNFLPLSNPNYNHGFYLQTDANTSAISFLLFQLDYTKITPEEENKLDYRQLSNLEKLDSLPKIFILCGSKKLPSHLKSQSVFKLELLSILYSLRTTRSITQFSEIRLFTDCKAILHIRLSKSQCPELQRSSLLLSSFRISLYHLPRELNTFTDLLGRGDEGTENGEGFRSLNPIESNAILRCLLVPDNLKVTSDNLQKLLLQESPRAILESTKRSKNKDMIKSSQITSEPSIKSKRKIKSFDVVIGKGESKKIIKVNMIREIEGPNNESPNMEDPDDPIAGPSNHAEVSNGYRSEQTDRETDLDEGQYNTLQSTRCLSEAFCRGLMSIEDFITCQQNDVAINNYPGKTVIVQGMICVIRKSSTIGQRRIRPICPQDVLKSFANTLHYSYKYFHSTARQLIRIIKRDFFILDESIIRDEVGKCFACLTAEQDMNTSQSFAENKLPMAIRTSLNFDIVSGLPTTPSGNRYIYACCDSLSGYFIAAPGSSRKPADIINFFKNSTFVYVIPEVLVLDQELGLGASGAFKRFCEFYNIKPRIVSTRFSESNAAIERLFFFLKKSCRLVSAQRLGDWDCFLPYITQAINSRITIYGYSSEFLTYFNTSRNISPIKVHSDFANYQEYIEDVRQQIEKIRSQFAKAKRDKIKSNLYYINKRRKPRIFEEGCVCLYRNIHLQKQMGTNRILYKPCIVIENLPSGTHCFIQSLVSNRILKYSYQYLKPIKSLNALSRISLPLEWQEKIREAMNRGNMTVETSENDPETSTDDLDIGPIGFGSQESQESLFSIRSDNDSQEEVN